ncbi:ANTAR domain-containing protein [Streptomyces sulfonofaciens]|uniref:ANTAR domain-containing protein n=1 Tax=Streptomyces sulfonofaciens TaxID=68272 RepID=A0A919GKJ1_9ACTN|nr:ANTAR domain-containing protein [Streptomyces sulfonofaciens]GHH86359.1 ANTAR domain-containing protein [Streptomyces sulfonofaciens]
MKQHTDQPLHEVIPAPAARIRQLEDEVTQLHQAIDSHATIDQALGVLVAVGHVSPAEAWDVLRKTSMHTNIKLRHVAELIVIWGENGHLAADIRHELARRLHPRLSAVAPYSGTPSAN